MSHNPSASLLHNRSEPQYRKDRHNSPLSRARCHGHRRAPDATAVRPATLGLSLARSVFDRMSELVFCDLFVGKTMNFDALSDGEYGWMELDVMIEAYFFDSSDSDEEEIGRAHV